MSVWNVTTSGQPVTGPKSVASAGVAAPTVAPADSRTETNASAILDLNFIPNPLGPRSHSTQGEVRDRRSHLESRCLSGDAARRARQRRPGRRPGRDAALAA